jgi:hypothetical protein
MSLVKANGVNVLGGSIIMPLRGVWSADLIIDAPDGSGFEADTAVSVLAEDGIVLHGTVVPDRTGSFLEAVHVRLLGGAGGMGEMVTPKGFAQPGAYVRDVLSNINDASGEELDTTVATSFLNSNLTAWNTVAVPAADALNALLDIVAPTYNWRVLDNGKLWIGEETWPDETDAFEVLSHNPTDNTYDLGVSSPSITVGCTLDGIGKVSRVEHTIEPDRVRSRVWVHVEGEERGWRAAVAKIVRQETAGIDYFTLYDAKIVAQSADGKTVDVQPGDARLPGLCKVPLRNGVAATVCKVATGTFVRLGWDRGNPSLPYACLWQGDETATEITIGGLSGAQFVALANKTNQNFDTFWLIIDVLGGADAIQITEPGNGAPSAFQIALQAIVALAVSVNYLPPPDVDAAVVKVK